MKFFRILITLLAIAAVAVSFAFFFETERRIKKLNEIKPQAEAMYAEWSVQNNCAEEPQFCKAYSQQFNEWILEFGKYKERKEQSLKFRFYFLLKDSDKEYAADFDYDGLASLTVGSVIFLLSSFLIAALLGKLGKESESKSTYKSKPARRDESIRRPELRSESMPEPKLNRPELKPIVKPEQELIQKATECAESSPMQAISYLEQALEKTSDYNLRNSVLLLCGSLRIKHNIGEDQGVEQLQKIIGVSPRSSEAEEAQKVLDAFK